MDSIEEIEKDLMECSDDRYLQLRILIQIAYQLQGLTAAIKNMRDV